MKSYRHFFADRHDFKSYRKSSDQKFLSANIFTSYQKSLETRLKSIEEKLGCHYSLLTINRHDRDGNNENKSYINLDTIIRAYQGFQEWKSPMA